MKLGGLLYMYMDRDVLTDVAGGKLTLSWWWIKWLSMIDKIVHTPAEVVSSRKHFKAV